MLLITQTRGVSNHKIDASAMGPDAAGGWRGKVLYLQFFMPPVAPLSASWTKPLSVKESPPEWSSSSRCPCPKPLEAEVEVAPSLRPRGAVEILAISRIRRPANATLHGWRQRDWMIGHWRSGGAYAVLLPPERLL